MHLLLLFVSAEPNNFLVHSQRLNLPSWRLLKNAMGTEGDSPRRCPNVCNHKGCMGKVSHFLDEYLGGNGLIWFIHVCLIKKSQFHYSYLHYTHRKGLRTFDGVKKQPWNCLLFSPAHSPGAWELAGAGLYFLFIKLRLLSFCPILFTSMRFQKLHFSFVQFFVKITIKS